MTEELAVIVSFTVKTDDRERFMALLRENARKSIAEEPGCRRFDILEPPQRPDEVWLYETYRDRAAFDAHLDTPHYRDFDSETRGMVAGRAVIVAPREACAGP